MSGSSIVVRATAAHVIDKAHGLAAETSFVKILFVQCWRAIMDAERATGPLVQPIRHKEGGFKDGRGVKRDFPETVLQILV